MKNVLSSVAVMLLAAVLGFGAIHAVFRTSSARTAHETARTLVEATVRDARGRPVHRVALTWFDGARTRPFATTDASGRARGAVPATAAAAGVRFEATKRGWLPARVVTLPFSRGASMRLDVTLRRPRSASRAPARRPGAEHGARAIPLPIEVVSGAAGDRAVASALATRLRTVSRAHRARLSLEGVAGLQVRMLWNEASYVEILPITARGHRLGGALLPAKEASHAALHEALAHLFPRPVATRPNGKGTRTSRRTLTVATARPRDARAYLDGRPLPRRIAGGNAVFDIPAGVTTAAPASLGGSGARAVLTLTSDSGPLIRSVLPRQGLHTDVRWTLPDVALSRR